MTFSDVSYTGESEQFAAIGIDPNSDKDMVVRWTFDTRAAPIDERSYGSSWGTRNQAYYLYVSISVEIDGKTFEGRAVPDANRNTISVNDALSGNYRDTGSIVSRAPFSGQKDTIGHTDWYIQQIFASGSSEDNQTIDGTAVPDDTEWSNLFGLGSNIDEVGRVKFNDGDGGRMVVESNTATYAAIPAVPAPAALPLYVGLVAVGGAMAARRRGRTDSTAAR